jgi:hypothetical protein
MRNPCKSGKLYDRQTQRGLFSKEHETHYFIFMANKRLEIFPRQGRPVTSLSGNTFHLCNHFYDPAAADAAGNCC